MTKRNRISLGEIFGSLGLLGDFSTFRSVEVYGIAEPQASGPGDLVFVSQERFLPLLQGRSPAAVVVSESLWLRAKELSGTFPLLCSGDAMLAFAKASVFFSSEAPAMSPGVHHSALVHPSARVHPAAHLGPYVQVAEGAEIGAHAVLHGSVQVGARSVVGSHCVLFPTVVLYQDVVLGERVRIHSGSVIGADGFGYVQEKTVDGIRHVKIHHLGGVKIGNDVEIGSSTTIDRGTLGDTFLGDGCVVDNQVQIGHNCRIEEGVVLCGGVALAGSVVVEKFALIAGFTAVANRVRIGAGAQVAGFSAITGNVPAGAVWGGSPAMPRGEFARLQVLFKRLPELFERKIRREFS